MTEVSAGVLEEQLHKAPKSYGTNFLFFAW
jgi:hypothetical protein